MTLPTSALSSDADADADTAVFDYTNPAHAATLTVRMAQNRISSSCSAVPTPTPSSCAVEPEQQDAPPSRRTQPQQQPLSRVVRRSSLSSSCPAPRRSSLRTGSSFCADGETSPPGSPRPRRRSSVTFNADANKTKTVPAKVESKKEREELFYSPGDYTQFRREHIREKRAEIRERAAMMTRWKTTFGSGGPSSGKKSSRETGDKLQSQDRSGGDAASSATRLTFGRIKSSVSAATTTAQFAQQFRRACSTQTKTASYTFTDQDGRGFAIPLDKVRAECARRGAADGKEPLGNVSMPAPAKPAVRTARLA